MSELTDLADDVRKSHVVEDWQGITDYDGYEVCRLGKARSLDRLIEHQAVGGGRIPGLMLRKGRVLAINHDRKGYCRVKLSKNNKGVYASLARLVATAFVPNPYNLPEVNHKDGNKDNNNDWNLEWDTRSGNMLHAFATGLKVPREQNGEANFSSRYTEDQIINVYNEIKKGATNKELAEIFSMHPNYINLLRTGKRWNYLYTNFFS